MHWLRGRHVRRAHRPTLDLIGALRRGLARSPKFGDNRHRKPRENGSFTDYRDSVINCRDPMGIMTLTGAIIARAIGEDVASITPLSRQMIVLSSHFGDT
jgi:hypothetical protein